MACPLPPGSTLAKPARAGVARGRWAHVRMDTQELVRLVLEDYWLPFGGVHGLPHWARVMENGRRLALETGADTTVIELFAILHDARRRNEDLDPEHGSRAAVLVRTLLSGDSALGHVRLELLQEACRHHSRGLLQADVTTQTCWDADRLDLMRVGKPPAPQLLCTEAARNPSVIAWASTRAGKREIPALVWQEWHIKLGHMDGGS